MTDNLALWHKVEKTDPGQVKPITGKSYKGTSPKPHYLIQKATETFGPCGIGWGFKVLDERIENGAMIEPGFFERASIARVLVWYKWDGERGEVEHVGGTTYAGRYSSGKIFTDEDAPKKSVTDALIKALSMIGFAGDIFMGRYDDSKYVNELAEEIRQEKRKASGGDEISAYVTRSKTAILNEDTREGLIAYWKAETDARATLRLKPGVPEYDALYEAYKARGHEFSKLREAAE
jgi:hypothetical protein